MMLCSSISAILFLSTPSARRATKDFTEMPQTLAISIHALREEGDSISGQTYSMRAISIHALREEGDFGIVVINDDFFLFLSTPSARRATARGYNVKEHRAISIHALREEGDAGLLLNWTKTTDFYPRPPRGGRRRCCQRKRTTMRFLSTPSARRATEKSLCMTKLQEDFYPRPPRGGRHGDRVRHNGGGRFLSTPSARRATKTCWAIDADPKFLSTPSARRATSYLTSNIPSC